MRHDIARAAAVVSLAVGVAACDSAPITRAAPPQPVVVGPSPTPAPEPAWTREPRDDADRALLRRLLDPRDDVRSAAVAEWEAARGASYDLMMKDSREHWPLRSETTERQRAWETDDDSTPVSPGHALRLAFDNRTRALTRGLVGALHGGDDATRAAAAAAMGAMWLHTGKQLTEALSDPAPAVRVAAAEALAAETRSDTKYDACIPAMVCLLDDPDWRVRAAGADGVTAFHMWSRERGEETEVATPRLMELAVDEHAEVRERALMALSEIAPYKCHAELRTLFAKALADSSPGVRSRAATWFGRQVEYGDTDPLPESVLAALRGLLTDAAPPVRWSAAYAVWRTTHDAATVVPVLAEQIAQSRGTDLVEPLRLLIEVGPDAESAVPAILSVLTEDTFVRHGGTGIEAIEALYAIGPPTATTLPLLEKMRADPSPGRRFRAALAVATLDGDAAAGDAVLAKAFACEADSAVRGEILSARAELGAGGDALVADLVRALHGEQFEQWRALDALRVMGPRAAAAATAIEPLLDDPDKDGTACRAADALAFVGGPARAAEILPRVRAWEHRPDYWVVRVLESAGPSDAALTPVLLAHLDESPVEIARALAGIGPAAKDALPRLDARMRSAAGEERIASAEAVLRIDGDRRALNVLVAALDPSLQTRDDLYDPAAWALARSADAARPAVQALRDAMTPVSNTPNYGVIAALTRVTDGAEPAADQIEWTTKYSHDEPPVDFVEALGAIGPAAARWTSFLERIALQWRTKDWDTDLCRAAIRALGQIGPGAQSALPSLRRLRRNALLRATADEAIRRIEAK
jgi:HEAT repeat protein